MSTQKKNYQPKRKIFHSKGISTQNKNSPLKNNPNSKKRKVVNPKEKLSSQKKHSQLKIKNLKPKQKFSTQKKTCQLHRKVNISSQVNKKLFRQKGLICIAIFYYNSRSKPAHFSAKVLS